MKRCSSPILAGAKLENLVYLSCCDVGWAISQGKWLISHDKDGCLSRSGYAYRCDGPKKKGGKRKLRWLHKEILKRARKRKPCKEHHIGDHINGLRRDNRRKNLRWATKSMNAKNRHGIAHRQLEMNLVGR